MSPTRPIGRDEDGFTVVEMLTAMSVFSIVLASFAMVLSSAIRHSGEVEETSNLQVEARNAITTLTQDLRQMYDGDADVATSPLESISSTQMTFLSPDRAQPFHLRRVSYRLTGGQLERAFATSTDTDGAPWSIPALGGYRKLVGSVANATPFVYRDVDGNVTSNRLLVKTIDISLVVRTRTAPSRQYTYKTSVTVRGES